VVYVLTLTTRPEAMAVLLRDDGEPFQATPSGYKPPGCRGWQAATLPLTI
jgi:hypothetical protein